MQPNDKLLSAKRCALLVLNWNGAKWLQQCLPSLVEAAAVVSADVIVVDNNSSDDSAEVVRTRFPSVQFWNMNSNKVLAAYNEAAARCTHDIIILLNNDLVADRNFIGPLMRWFDDDLIFAVSPAAWSYPPSEQSAVEFAAEGAVWKWGMIRQAPKGLSHPCATYFTSGGFMACRRDRFLRLGGIDELFFPTYSDDRDLGYRAWKLGWRCIVDPQSVVYHAGGSTMGRNIKTMTLWAQNDFLFHWKNLDWPRLGIHLLLIPPRLAYAAIRGRWHVTNGFWGALKRIKHLRASRSFARKHAVTSDPQVWAQINSAQVQTPV